MNRTELIQAVHIYHSCYSIEQLSKLSDDRLRAMLRPLNDERRGLFNQEEFKL